MNAHGGMSMSNTYDVEFVFKESSGGLSQRFKSVGITTSLGTFGAGSDLKDVKPSDPGSIIKLFCDEAQLPNRQSATGEINGRFLGQGQISYPHTQLFDDFQLTWMCDANMTPLKFLNVWYDWIFQKYDSEGNEISPNYYTNQTLENFKNFASGGNNQTADQTIRLHYPKTYFANILIVKTERSKNAANGRASVAYNMIDCYPYIIDAVPLSYGASQITRVSATFRYTKFNVSYNNIGKFKG
jgi:hypothetical protein